jgi:hypothetical protein
MVAGVYFAELYVLLPACFDELAIEVTKATDLPAWYILHDLLLSRHSRLRASVSISVRLGHDQRYEVNPRPSVLALKLAFLSAA